MARKRIALRQFFVSSERDDGGVRFEHSYRQCDWHAWVDGMSPREMERLAREHGRKCDGKPQPRPEPTPNPLGSLLVGVWGREIHAALEKRLTETTAFVTGAR